MLEIKGLSFRYTKRGAMVLNEAELALEMGNAKVLNVIMLGVYVGFTEVIEPEIVWQTIEHKLAGKPKLLPLNRQAFDKGLELGRAQKA